MARRLKPAGRCIFCHGFGLSKEHVLPDWLGEIFPQSSTDTHTVGEFDWIKILGHGMPIQNTTRKQGQAGTRKVRVVCEKNCNNGWLSRLETAAKPVLTALVHGYSRTLPVADQKILATWIAKTTMTAEFVRMDKSPSASIRAIGSTPTRSRQRTGVYGLPFTAARNGSPGTSSIMASGCTCRHWR
jgi:hypothetical protein